MSQASYQSFFSEHSVIRKTLPQIVPALCVGILCSLILIGVSLLADQLELFWWTWLPKQINIASNSPFWIFFILTITGMLVAAVVWKMPGHAGPDPATTSLIDPPMPPGIVSGLLIALILGLGGGVSLGPENPIMAVNIALMVFLGGKLMPDLRSQTWMTLAVCGTIGAMFGTPLAVALMLSETTDAESKEPLWDRLVVPLTAAGAGALTTDFLAGSNLSLHLTQYPGFHLIDLVSGSLITMLAAIVGLVAVYVYPLSHRLFACLKYQPLMILCGGVLLGLLGILGGEMTLFKGLDQTKQLASHIGDYTLSQILLMIGVKLTAILIAATSGFRGGRIFPALFVGVAIGIAAHVVCPSIPISLAIASGAIGLLLVVTRQGWLTFFMAVTLVPDIPLIPTLCLTMLPAWLIVTGRPQMIIPRNEAVTQ